MARKSSPYKKMPGKWFTVFGREALYQGPDHLLWVQSSLIKEHYKRFYYNDIQALQICRNRRQHLWTAVWVGLVVLFFAIAVFIADTSFVAEFFIAGFAVCLLINFIKGPCCDVYLQTAVQLEKMSHLPRERMAIKTLDRVKALAEAAQGPFAVDKGAFGQGLAAETHWRGNDPAGSGSATSVEGHDAFNPRLHYALFGLLLLTGGVGLVQWQWPSLFFPVAGMICFAGTVVLTIMALVRWHQHIQRTLLSFASWMTLAWLAVYATGLYVLYIATSMRHPNLAYNQTGLLKAFLEMQLEDHPVTLTVSIAVTAVALVLAGVGLVAASVHGRRPAAPGDTRPVFNTDRS